MRKIYLTLIFAGILGFNNALFAEESGWFVGAQLGSGGVNLKYKHCGIYQPMAQPMGQPKYEEYCSIEHQQGEQDKIYNSFLEGERHDFKSIKYGFLAGYKQFFTPKFGLRYYAAFNVGKYKYNGKAYQRLDREPYEWEFRTTYTHKISEQHLSFNVDALYNFITNDTWDFGVFGGVSLGYVIYKYDMNEGINWYYRERGYKQIDKMQDFDIGLNFGVRANLIKRHSIELYSRFSLMKQRETYIVIPAQSFRRFDYITTTLTNKPLTNFGIRYIFSF